MESLFDKLTLPGICEFIGSFDIACLGETFTLPDFDFSLKFEDFIAVHWPAEKFTELGRPSGGLVVLIKKKIKPFVEIIKTNVNHVICLKIKKELLNSAKDLLYISTYIHPSNSVFYSNKTYDDTLEMLEEFLADELQKEDNVDILLNGDLNARIGEWCFSMSEENQEDDTIEFHRSSQDAVTNPYGRKLIELCNTFNLVPLNGLTEKSFDNKYTFLSRRGNSTIDHFLCSHTYIQHVTNLKIINRLESQHLPVTIQIEASSTEVNENDLQGEIKKCKWQEKKTHECENILNREESLQTLNEAMEAVDQNNVNHSVSLFTTLMQKVGKPMEHVIQLGKKFIARKPWFDRECVRKKKETLTCLSKMGKINNRKQPNKYQRAKCSFLEKKLEYQKLIKDKRKAYSKQMKEKLVANCKDSKSFWGTIKQLSSKRTKLPNIPIEQWFCHYSNLLNPSTTNQEQPIYNNEEEVSLPEIVSDDYLDEEITKGEVNNAMDRLKKNKAPGDDEVTAELLLLSKDKIFPYLCKLFNKIFELGVFPISWGIAIVIPLYKKGDRDICNNYRGISLLSVTSKIYTSIINNRLYNWAEANNKINEEQAGFRRNYSTVDHIFTLHTIASNCLYGNKRSKLYAAFIDFQKAFDTVNRDRLWKILEKNRGIHKND